MYNMASGIVEQTWQLSLTKPRTPSTTEVRGLRWLEEGRTIAFSTGMDGGIEIYDSEKNLKWRFGPGIDDAGQLAHYSRPISSHFFWCTAAKTLVCVDADDRMRAWKLT
jgi:hypothetical protein